MSNIIYLVKNNFNGFNYIGATKHSLEKRKLDHEERAFRGENSKFQEAISTYGVEAFTWKQIDTASNTDELAQKEKEYVLIYNSKEKGYNSDSGGGFKKTVYQYSLEDGSLVNSFDDLQSAGNAISANKQQLSRACLSVNKVFNGFYWSYEFKEPFKPETDRRTKIVNQIDITNNMIHEYKSISEASELTGVNRTSIAKVCRGERNFAGGYKWTFN